MNSCSHEKSNQIQVFKVNKERRANIVPTDQSITFRISNRIVNRSTCLMPFTSSDSTTYLFYLSGYSNNICVFDLETQQIVKTISLQFEGPNGVGTVMGFEVISFDSIYITPMLVKKLYLVNSDGKVLSSIDYSTYSQSTKSYIPSGTSRTLENMRMVFQGEKIYLPYYPGIDEVSYKSFSPLDTYILLRNWIKKKTIRALDVGFPSGYWDSGYYHPFFGFFSFKDKYYIDYMYDDQVVISSDLKSWKAYAIPSQYIHVKEQVKPEAGMGARYARLVPDPNREVFYRFVIHAQGNIENRVITDLVRYPSKFSIMIFDAELNILGETKLPVDIYDVNGYFITKDGLFSSPGQIPDHFHSMPGVAGIGRNGNLIALVPAQAVDFGAFGRKPQEDRHMTFPGCGTAPISLGSGELSAFCPTSSHERALAGLLRISPAFMAIQYINCCTRAFHRHLSS